jgi:serine/threonine-protein kinase
MTQPNADRNLLFGILAVQMDFVSRDQLMSAMQAWMLDKANPIGAHLVQLGALAEDTRSLLEALVTKHLARHDDDPAKSLAAVDTTGSVTEQLRLIADSQMQTSLGHVRTSPVPEADDPYATRASVAPAASPLSAGSRTIPTEAGGTRPASAGEVSASGVRFRILRPHASGGLGDVLVARDAELNRDVALKQIKPDHASDPDSQGRFLLEAEITGGLEHPSIVPVYGLGHYADGRPYYAMRFIRGDSLKEAIEHFHKHDTPDRDPGERSLELRDLLGRFVDVCNAIAYAHSRGVLHRDLKPGNIMLGKYGETLVVDWGLAKPLDAPPQPEQAVHQPGEGTLTPASASFASQTVMGSAVGTPQFMSPEQAAGRIDQLGPASDVYSLGATLFSLLTGAAPIADPDAATVLHKVKLGEVRSPRQVKPNVPMPLDAICRKAMALDPADRYATPRVLADDIEHWLADEPVSAWPEPWTVKARRWIGRHQLLVTSVASAILVATVSLTIATVLLNIAWDNEKAAKKLAMEERDEKERQRKIADDNYRLARSAVDRYHTDVSENVLLHEPGVEPLRKKLLEAAREFYGKFIDARGDEKGLQAEMGRALFRLAQITADIDVDGQKKGIDLHQQAAKVFASLPAEEAATPEIQSELASCWHHQGRLYRLTDKPEQAEDAYKKALAIWEKLTELHPADERLQAERARSQNGLGNVFQVTTRLDHAVIMYDKALATRARLAAAHPEEAAYQRDEAVTHWDLARVLDMKTGQHTAEKEYAKALAIQERLVRKFKHITQYRDDQATVLFNIGNLRVRSGDHSNALEPYQKATKIWTDLVDTHPDVTQFNVKLGDGYAAQAQVFSALREPAKAEEAANKSLEISKEVARHHKDQSRYEGNVALGQFQLGDVLRANAKLPAAVAAYEEAIRILGRLVGSRAGVPQHRADLARTYNSLGLLREQQDDQLKAGEAYRDALKLWDQLLVDHAQNIDYVVGYSTSATNLGYLIRTQNTRAALDLYGKALRSLAKLTPEQRQTGQVPATLRLTHWRRAETLTEDGNHVEAIDDWDRVVEMSNEKNSGWAALLRAVTLARAGLHVRAASEAERLSARITEKDKQGRAIYKLVGIYALASGAAAGDVKLATADREMLAEQYGGRAVELLRKVQATGYFKTTENRDRLNDDVDLTSIRQRADFRKLLDDLGSKKASTGQ